MAQQTAVEWLHYKWSNCKEWKWEEIEQWFEQAKQMEKSQIEEAFKFGVYEGFFTDINYLNCDNDAKYYYNETYGKKEML